MSKKYNQFNSSLVQNTYTYKFYLQRLTEIAISMFTWENLPNSVDSRFLEKTLFVNGSAVFFKDPDLTGAYLSDSVTSPEGSFLALPVISGGVFNVYNVPIKYRAFANNGYNKELDINNSVLVFNNMVRTNSTLVCEMFARRLWNIDRAIDINANAQKTPVLIQATPQQRQTMINLYKEYDGNAPYIFGDKNLDLNGIKAINTGAPFVADKLYQLKSDLWNEALTYLGISNISYQKKERLISDEVNKSQGGTIASRESRLKARKQACEQINDMFGLNIDVHYSDDVEAKTEEQDEFTDDLNPDDEGSDSDE